jgi:chaperonin GroEL
VREDIVVLTGDKFISEDLEIQLENMTIVDLSQTKHMPVEHNDTTIVEGNRTKGDVDARTELIRMQIEETSSDDGRAKWQERLVKLASGVVVIGIGVVTEPEMKVKRYCLDDALQVTRAAVEEDIDVGVEVALLYTQTTVSSLRLEGNEALGVDIVRRAIEAPLRHLCHNTGVDGSLVVQDVLHSTGSFGYTVETGKYEDLVKAGIVDRTTAARSVL